MTSTGQNGSADHSCNVKCRPSFDFVIGPKSNGGLDLRHRTPRGPQDRLVRRFQSFVILTHYYYYYYSTPRPPGTTIHLYITYTIYAYLSILVPFERKRRGRGGGCSTERTADLLDGPRSFRGHATSRSRGGCTCLGECTRTSRPPWSADSPW